MDDQVVPMGESPLVFESPLVLIVDDDIIVCDLLRYYLNTAGFRAVTAQDGPTGLDIARELQPAAITLDVLMPGMDVWDFLREIKNDPDLTDIPVIMCPIIDEKNKSFSLCATDYLVKPIGRDRLLQILHRICPGGDCHVLIVDDDGITRETIRLALAQTGLDVSEAENSRVALDRLSEKIPDIILLDLMMPEMDGFQLIDEVKKHVLWWDIPIVVIIAKDLTEEDRNRLNSYMRSVVSKGNHAFYDVIKTIRTVLTKPEA